jgi:hypothetical protein
MYRRQQGTTAGSAAVWAAGLMMLFAATARADMADTSATGMGSAMPKYDETRVQPSPIQVGHYRPNDARGIDMFEPPKAEVVAYDGFRLQWGAAFTQQFQDLRHSNQPDTSALNRLINIGAGFNNADANLYMNAQLARGIRVQLTSYLSSRHHNETWVKDGYLLVDGSPWADPRLDNLMKYVTLRLGHFEINYGDMHFRRSDNGQAMFNPLVGNLIMDAFTTEIGGEIYVRANSMLAMAAVTGGEVRGQVLKPEQRSPSYMGKLGFDRQMRPDARVRLTGSFYVNRQSTNNTLYSGSRAGSRYFYVLENTNATESAQAWSGDLQPGFRQRVTAWVVNPFVQFHGLELFGNIEQAKGKAANETADRTWTQLAGDGTYRFCHNHLYAAARYNTAKGPLVVGGSDVTIRRFEGGGGWFITPNLEAKGEYVQQKYDDFPTRDIRHGGKFDGAMFEAVVSF